MKERPILFSGEMVRAILDGRKTQTRRVIKPQPYIVSKRIFWSKKKGHSLNALVDSNSFSGSAAVHCPYGQPGDRLWVRETWAPRFKGQGFGREGYSEDVFYRADFKDGIFMGHDENKIKWKPSIHMRREYSRINLEITNIRVERLQDISGMDAKREGVSIPAHLPHDGADLDYARREYINLWNKINGPGSWDLNPFVWVVEFRRVS